MAITLTGLMQALQEGSLRAGLEASIHTILGLDSELEPNTDFLYRFPELRYYEGSLRLSEGQHLELLTQLQFGWLRLKVAPGLLTAAELGAVIENLTYEVLELPLQGLSINSLGQLEALSVSPELSVLLGAAPRVKMVKGPLDVSQLERLPASVQEVRLMAANAYWEARPRFELVITAPHHPPPITLDMAIVGLKVALTPSQAVELLELNPQLVEIGLQADMLSQGLPTRLKRHLERLDKIWLSGYSLEALTYAESLLPQGLKVDYLSA